MTSKLQLMVLLGGVLAPWASADNKTPAIVVDKEKSPQYVKLTTDARITIKSEGGVATFVVDESDLAKGKAEGATISFDMVDFDELATAIEQISAEKEIVSTEYYTLQGVKLNEPQKGVNIVRVIYSDGSTSQIKTLKK